MQNLGMVRCLGAGYGGKGRTKIRIIQYAMYGDRGVWLAKKLRSLWNAGCDIRMIYSLVTRPVLQIMRNRSGRGPIPMRQSVTKNGSGVINKYNHSKWMTITGNWNGMTSAWVTFNGSANWSIAAFPADEQMQRLRSVPATRPYLFAFNKTWSQKTSKRPPRAGSPRLAGRCRSRASPRTSRAGVRVPTASCALSRDAHSLVSVLQPHDQCVRRTDPPEHTQDQAGPAGRPGTDRSQDECDDLTDEPDHEGGSHPRILRNSHAATTATTTKVVIVKNAANAAARWTSADVEAKRGRSHRR